jgi:GNAT superfamily N-acetyltransferase
LSQIVEVGPSDARLDDVYPVLHELRTELTPEEFRTRYALGFPDGYRIAALYDGDECRAVAGYRVLVNFVRGKVLYIDDLVTTNAWRSKGYGKALNEYLIERARAEGCAAVTLDSHVDREGAHRFYFREGYAISSFHFGRFVE